MPTFRGKLEGRQIVLNVWISNPDPNKEATQVYRALLDTGATISVISPKVLEDLTLSPDGWMLVDGVHNAENLATCSVGIFVPVTEFPQDEQPSTSVRGLHRMQVAVMGHQPDRFNVLLGMDLLRDCHFTLFKDEFIISI